MARNNNDYLKWEDIEKAVMDYYAGRVMSKYGSVRDCKLARSEVEGVLYELEYVPAADMGEIKTETRTEAYKEIAEKIKEARFRLFNSVYSEKEFSEEINKIVAEKTGERG